MPTVEQQVEQLRYTIAEQQQEIATLETEIRQIRASLSEFEARYNRIVKPVSERVQAAKAALQKLSDLNYQRDLGNDSSVESLWRKRETPPTGEYPASRRPPPPIDDLPDDNDLLPTAERGDEDAMLKKLYRKLALKYHPDKASNEYVRAIYTRLMARINTAYAEKDLDALMALDDSPDGAKSPAPDSSMTVMQLRNLQQKTVQLRHRILELKDERSGLRNGIMMDLKLRAALAQSKGRDMLKEMAGSLEREYQEYMSRIDALRRKL